ncbi:MGMT family protein [Cohnella rhizosphaerae]|uniref:MGMT family protein n=1 Tax=Cohnella rhizosphaerae TaxID=1457232 RepID=A0A9X4KUW8_9BACL|nr:MGMT family protein [Cohnella rhizosphaerae]MDG0811564.1 MGMT family protein [Cohnella rhizosphaerae]
MQPYTARVVEVIKAIPPGTVMTYGQVAAAAGSPRGARRVVWVLHSLSEAHGLPWHRVVNAKGEIALPGDEARYTQRSLLEEEGVLFDGDYRVDLAQCRWDGASPEGEG